MLTTKTLQVKVRSGHAWLNQAARQVNQVWNYANEVSCKAARPFSGRSKFLTGFDLNKLTAGSTNEFSHIGADTIQAVGERLAETRKAAKRSMLRWRKSNGANRSLGWVPFKAKSARFKNGRIIFAGQSFRIFDSYGLGSYKFRAGSFSQNALGEWFLNICVSETAPAACGLDHAVGIDLGLKTVATCSDGLELQAGRFYRGIEPQIAQAQRRGHKRQAKRLHRRAANRRKDALHKFTTKLVRENGCIYVGDVSSTKLVKTRMAKSVLDAGWGMLRTMLIQKGHRAGVIVEVVNERNTTRACSACGCLSGPKGLYMLDVREWICAECGSAHNRDINAARNILALGQQRPLAGTPNQRRIDKQQQVDDLVLSFG